jgi:hypothetical protein
MQKVKKTSINYIFIIYLQKTRILGAFPHVYDKTKPEIDSVAVGKAYMDPLS